MVAVGEPARGRPRDTDIDARVLDVARRHLARHGYEAMSLVAVAEEAGTTRQALYRRWPTKADLATAAIAAMARAAAPEPTDDPFADLVRELEAFRHGISRPDGLAMVGTMFVGSTDPQLVAFYRERVVAPRRARLGAALERALDAGLLDAGADVDTALNTLTGSWYARALAGDDPPARWAERVATLVWRGLGGRPPTAAGTPGARPGAGEGRARRPARGGR
ncbi:MAG: TetR/AcrR family transcriptional regulator [Acidimicrobiales bacterium]|nr:TetR/AcrR family transcriptional regulator [Acidimicrobiales bacterium]